MVEMKDHHVQKVITLTLVYMCLLHTTTGQPRPSTMVLQNNQFTNVVVALHDSIAEDKTLIDKLKDTMTKASQTLYTATRQRAYFREIVILLPSTWSDDASYGTPTSQTINLADVIITDNFRRKRSVHTRSYRGCGEQGVHVLLNKEFMTIPRAAPYFNRPDKYFVHAFAQFRWGVFQEYAEEGEQLFYISLTSGRPEAVRCVLNMRGLVQKNDANHTICYTDIDPNTGLYSDGCLWRPYPYRQPLKASMMDFQFINEIETFCDDNTTNRMTIHNYEAPSKHNRLCEHRSVWDVIQNSADFRGGINPAVSVTPSQLTPTFRIVKATSRKRRAVVTLDPSILNQLDNQNVFIHLGRLKQEADRHDVPLTISVSNRDVIHEHHIVSIDDLKRVRSTNITRNIHTVDDEVNDVIAINGLGLNDDSEAGPSLKHTLLDQFHYSVQNVLTSQQAFIILKKDEFVTESNKNHTNAVYVDESISSTVSFVFHYTRTKPVITITPPTGTPLPVTHADVNEELREIVFHAKPQAGEWTYTVTSEHSQEITVAITAKADSLHNIDVRLTLHEPKMPSTYFQIFVDVTQYHHPVIGLNVTALIETPSWNQIVLNLFDNGAGADLLKDDGVYSRYFTHVTEPGTYYVTADIFGNHGNVVRKETEFEVETEEQLQGPAKVTTRIPIQGPIQRHIGRQSIHIESNDVTNNSGDDIIAPCRITDLTVTKHVLYKDVFSLSFTAPGDDLDHGKVSHYEVYVGEEITSIQDFITYTMTSSYDCQGRITKKLYRAKEVAMETEVLFYKSDRHLSSKPVVFGVVGVDEAGNRGRVSNIVTVQLKS